MTFIVNCTARFAMVVSAVVANGIPVGNDSTGDGSPANPWLTLNKARSLVPPGGKVVLNGDPASPTAYRDGSSTFTATINIEAVPPLGAILAGSGTSEAIVVQPSGAGQTFTFRNVIIDPSANTSGPGNRCATIVANSGVFLPNITFDGVKFQNWTTYCAYSDVALRVSTITLSNVAMVGGNVNGGFAIVAAAAGSLVVTGGSCTVSALNTAGTGGALHWVANTAGTAVSVSNLTTAITVDPATLSSGPFFGCRIVSTPGVVFDGGTHQVLGAPSVATGCPISIETNAAGLPMDGGIVRNLTAVNTTNGGYCIRIGVESLGSFPYGNNMLIDNCTVSGNAASAAGSVHGCFLGVTTNSKIQNCRATDVGLLGIKESSNGQILNNTVTGYSLGGIIAKSLTGGTISGNQVTQTGTYANTNGIFIEQNVDTGTPSTGIVVSNNVFTMNGGANSVFVSLDNFGSTFTPDHNSYIVSSGTMAANRFTIGATNYTSCGAYKAAVEPTANCSPL